MVLLNEMPEWDDVIFLNNVSFWLQAQRHDIDKKINNKRSKLIPGGSAAYILTALFLFKMKLFQNPIP